MNFKGIVLFGREDGDEQRSATELFLRKIANVLSIAFHPMMMPIYAMIYLLYFNSLWSLLPAHYKTVTMLYVTFGTSLLPLLSTSMLVMFGYVGDPEMPNKSERILPLIVSTILVGMTCFFVHTHVELPFPMVRLTEGMLIMLIMSTIITPMWKISLHGMGVGALLTFVTITGFMSRSDFSNAACVAFAIAGIVGWARLYLGSHTPLQLLVGQLAGMLAMVIAILHP